MARSIQCLGLCAALLVGCGSSHSARDDSGGITFDAMIPDAGTDGGGGGEGGTDSGPRDARVPACGDGILDPMEMCDDGNTATGDGCDDTCFRETFCGNGDMDPGEECDDGNNRSGDGCRADCLSDETCGNGIRDIAVGERCDDGNTTDGDGCAADCTIVEGCGDGTMGAGEACDDGNTDPWDGCGADCQKEYSLIIDSLEIGGMSVGCDFSGDGRVDNSLARALGPGVDLINSMFLADAIANGDVMLLLSLLGLDDPAAISDPSLTVAWMQGVDTDMNPMNNFSGDADVLASRDAFNPDGTPTTSFASMITSRMLSGGPEDVVIPVMFIPLDVRQGRLHGTTRATSGEVSGLDDGLLCGAVPLGVFALLPNLIDMFGMGMSDPPCSEPEVPANMADILIGSTTIFGIRIGGVAPDVDLDGDGLESFEVARGMGCQAVVTACIDGDGTRVEGRECTTDPRFEDGWSTGIPFTAVGVNIVGIEGAMMPPGP